jgi:hypothetical protein
MSSSTVDGVRAERRTPEDDAAHEAFVNKARVNAGAALLALPAPDAPMSQVSHLSWRRGRPLKYRWQHFAAEMTRRCMAGPITNQAALERHMQEWCTETNFGDGNEPSPSRIREWVSKTFNKIRPPNAAENSAQELPAKAL